MKLVEFELKDGGTFAVNPEHTMSVEVLNGDGETHLVYGYNRSALIKDTYSEAVQKINDALADVEPYMVEPSGHFSRGDRVRAGADGDMGTVLGYWNMEDGRWLIRVNFDTEGNCTVFADTLELIQ